MVVNADENNASDPNDTLVNDVAAGADTNTGDETVVVEFIPSCPEVFNPQPYIWPVVVIPSDAELPAAIADHDAFVGPDTRTGDGEYGVNTPVLPRPSSWDELSPQLYKRFVVIPNEWL